MLGPVRDLARTALSFVLTRTQLAATELEEQGLRLVEILIWLAIALFFMFGMPPLTGLPLSAFRIFYPDLGVAWMAVTVIGIAWSVIFTALVLLGRNSSGPSTQ